MNILIINLHSALNLGDQAILRKTLDLLKAQYPKAKFSLMANHPQSWMTFNEVKIVPSFITFTKQEKVYSSLGKFLTLVFALLFDLAKIRDVPFHRDISEMIKLIDEANIIFSCGGGNFYTNSIFGFDFTLNILCMIYSGLKKKPLIMLPQSFGPFKTKAHLWLLKIGLHFSNLIFVRDNISEKLLLELKIPKDKVEFLPDLALAVENINQDDDDEIRKINGLKIGVTVISRDKQLSGFKNQVGYQNELINTLKYLLDYQNATIFLFVQCYGPSSDQNDNFITKPIYQELKSHNKNVYLLNDYKDSSKLIRDLSHMDLIIASRMHTAIFGIINIVPTLLIGYQPKAEGLFQLFGLNEYYLSIEGITKDELKDKVLDLLYKKPSVISKLNDLVPTIRKNIIERITKLKW